MSAALGGHFVVETRNPSARAWEHRATEYTAEVADATGAIARCECRVAAVVGEVVHATSTFTSPGWGRPQVSHGMLRFLDAAVLHSFLSDAGLVIEEQFGDWARQPLTDTSPEIIRIVRKG